MNILVLTSSMPDLMFSAYQDSAQIKPNPSNQNFYSKLIKTLSLNANVAVVSLRPFVKGMFKKHTLESEEHLEGNVKYFFPYQSDSKVYKFFREYGEIIRASKKAIDSLLSKDFVIVVDTLRFNLLKAATHLGKEYNVKVVGMLTDNPYNITNINKAYAGSLVNNLISCDGFLSLTRKLVDQINYRAPAYIFEGLAQEEISNRKDPISNYYFFAGSLYERYGVKDMVDAFHESCCNTKLLVAGNGPLNKYIDKLSSVDSRIVFLSQISKAKCIAYELNAKANINPRPINEKLDKESVPSKLLEYFSTGTPVISTKYEKFYNIFKDNAYWMDDTREDMKNMFESFEKVETEVAKKNALVAKTKLFELYGLSVQSESIINFLKTI